MARAMLNDSAGAAEAFKTAHRLGAPSAQGAYAIAKEASGQGEHRVAARSLASAIVGGYARSDQAMRFLLLTSLGIELHSIGYLTAGNEAIESALRAPRQFATTTAQQADLSELARRVPSLWIDVGDIWVRLGEPDRAIAAFEQSAAVGLAFGRQPVVRIASVRMRQGRSADAATTLIEALADPRFTLDDRLVSLSADLFHAETRASPMIGPAIDGLRAARRRPPTADAWLARARAAASDPATARNQLAAAIDAYPHVGDLVDDLILRSGSPDDAVRASVDLIRRDSLLAGQCAGALLNSRGPLSQVYTAARSASAPQARLLEAYLALLDEDPLAALEALAPIQSDSALDPGLAMAQVEACSAAGTWSGADAALARLDPQRGVRWALARSRALQAMNRLAEGARVLEPLLDRPDPETGRVASQLASIATARADGALARRALDAALRQDPAREDALQGLLSLDAGNPQAERTIADRLRAMAPAGRLIRRLAIQELLAIGDRAQAEQRLASLSAESPHPGPALELLLSLWERSATLDGGVSIDRGLGWVDASLAERPDQIDLVRARVRLLVAAGRAEAAERVVLDRLAVRDSPAMRRAHEQVLRMIPGRAAHAQSMAEARLARTPDAIPTILERMSVALRRSDVAAARSQTQRWPRDAEVTAAHQAAVADAIAVSGGVVAREADGPLRAPFLDVTSWALDAGVTLPPSLHQLRIGMLAMDDPPDLASITGAVGLAIEQQPAAADGLAIAAPRYLASVNRFGDALDVIERVDALHSLDEAGLELWVRLIASGGGVARARRLIESAPPPPDMRAVVERVFGPIEALPDDPRSLYGHVVFQLANAATFFGRDQDGMDLNEYSLELDPTNAWAANNLGYSLADRGERLQEAERLLQFAYEALPHEASIVDSLGWVRYRAGVIHDAPASAGTPSRLGAVTLLRRAVELAGDSPSAEMLDHLGDALWSAGEHDEAQAAWSRAVERAQADRAGMGDNAPEPQRDTLDADIASIQGKLDACRAGREPAVAAIIGAPPA